MSNPQTAKPKDALARTFRIVLISLVISILTLAVIYWFRISMDGYGFYLYILVMASAVIYLISTVIFVFLSVKAKGH
jgi:hypothetical protein